MFTSISATSTTANADAAIPEHATGSLNATTKRSTGYAAAVAASVVLFALLSPTTATAQQDRVSALTELSVGAAAKNANSHVAVATPDRNGPTALTSHLPWLAPVGHRQPRREDVPQNEASSARERQQQLLDKEIGRKLIICRDCFD
jgi:hypothetical protein